MAKQSKHDELKSMNDSGFDPVRRIIWVTGEILSTKSQEYLDSRMHLLESQGNRPITIKINSGGGCIYESAGMAGRILASPCHVEVDVVGIAMSGALSLVAAGDHRRISRLATLMHHQAATLLIGRSGKLNAEVQNLLKEDRRRMEFLAERSKKSVEWWESVCKKGDFYMTPQEALTYGIVDEVY